MRSIHFYRLMFAIGLLVASRGGVADTALVAVAANMAPVATVLTAAFEASTGDSIRLSIGASGNLAQQILRGAPFEMFLAADESYPALVCKRGRCLEDSVHYATGSLLLYTDEKVSSAKPITEIAINELLLAKPSTRIAIANPQHAPYGKAAREVLQHLRLWDELQARLVFGENVAQATRFAASESVSFAILPMSVRSQFNVEPRNIVSIPKLWHTPLNQHMVLLVNAGPTAKKFFSYVGSSEAQQTLLSFGYSIPSVP